MVWSPVQGFLPMYLATLTHTQSSAVHSVTTILSKSQSVPQKADRKCNNLELSMNESMKGAGLDPAVVAVARA